jgi:hypothetical protein
MRTSIFSHVSPSIRPALGARTTRQLNLPQRRTLLVSGCQHEYLRLRTHRANWFLANRAGEDRGHLAFAKSSVLRSKPVLMKPPWSQTTHHRATQNSAPRWSSKRDGLYGTPQSVQFDYCARLSPQGDRFLPAQPLRCWYEVLYSASPYFVFHLQ